MTDKITAQDIADTVANAVNWDGDVQRADVPAIVVALSSGQRFAIEVTELEPAEV